MLNRKTLRVVILLLALGLIHFANASPAPEAFVLADTQLLRSAGIPILDADPETGVSLARVDFIHEKILQELAHSHGKCGGYERLPTQAWMTEQDARQQGREALLQLTHSHRKLLNDTRSFAQPVVYKEHIAQALAQVSETELHKTVDWLSNYETRYHAGATPNLHVEAFGQKIAAMLKSVRWGWTGDLISHQSTRQKSVRIRIPGRSRPDEIVVLGAHLDSISQTFLSNRAPGADDNASGSSNLLEALRILSSQEQPERTIEFFWYAGEEAGLLGSAEIAREYARSKKNVVAALQLDMTLFPGDGEFVLGSMTDFTSPGLRSWFADLNRTYIGAKIINDKCGYACSDHASWHSNGYPALMPFEASFDRMFPDLHTPRDVISDKMSFKHSAMFSKVAVAFAMELAGY